MSRLPVAAAAGLTLMGAPLAAAHLAEPDPHAWEAQVVYPWLRSTGAPAAFTDLRRLNPEYDFMARTFTVLALADRALRAGGDDPEAVAVMDAILEDTLAEDAAAGPETWLLPYGRHGGWVADRGSLFVDGELLVMLGARRLVADDDARWALAFDAREAAVVAHLTGPTAPFAESYPNEGWLFCHGMALVGLRMAEALDGADHGALLDAVVAGLVSSHTDPETGLLRSSFAMDGAAGDGPEGSSLWFATVALRLVDPAVAESQYAGARGALGRTFLGWGYSREWPVGAAAVIDVDSGPLVPVLQASPSASGLAIAASAAAGDRDWHRQLTGALGAAEVSMAVLPPLREVADNPVGQAVVLWGLGFGPTWEAVAERAPRG